MSEAKFQLDRTTLAEMAQLAATCPIDTSKLEWTEVQQVLTLWSLQELFKTYLLELPYEIKLKDDK